ncbi:MAG: S8 family serine peptidase [Salibacteraceae bacterium]
MLRVSTVLLISLSFLLNISVYAQDKMSTQLNNWARSSERGVSDQEVWLQFDAQLDYEKLDQEFRTKDFTIEQRAKAVIQASEDLHLNSMNQLKKLINARQIQEEFWLGNSVIVILDKNDALALSLNQSVRWMELTSEHQVTVEDVEMEQSSSEKDAVNGAEPGLKAINAHKMWARGYSGKGRKALIIDTGVWPDHPAISDAWIGNREPALQSWYGFDSPVPKDKGNSHGTHVTGTILGLDPANNDTIGVAFDAAFMASDPVASQPSERKGLYSIIRAYQWALKPYNYSPAPTYDFPDVINNSWGHEIDTSEHICTNPFGDAVAACQLAGIAVVWSAGNNGPGAKTLGAPATITKNPYLVFTVGAINANDPNFPIAGFSSRGPSYCAQKGIDSIKPEVVAPGVNVRSAVGADGYANYQGTSMAGPHVAGAVLLLKEAFPTLPGQDILEALYKTANDLGPVGEDNAYGNGMINVDSAFKWLALTNTAILPVVFNQDINIELVSVSEQGISCKNEVIATFRIYNNSNKIVLKDSINITGNLTHGSSSDIIKTLQHDISVGDSVDVDFKFNKSQKNETEFFARIGLLQNLNDNHLNNTAYGLWKSIPESTIPFMDDFTNKTDKWIVDNPDNDQLWNVRIWEDKGIRNEALQLEFYSMNQRNDQQDFLISPMLKVADNSQLQMTFDYAYASKSLAVFEDSLSVEVTSVCNSNWKSVWAKNGLELATTTDTTSVFIPSSHQWESATIDLFEFDDEEFVQVRFVGTNGFGNNLYIDNVAITALQPTDIEQVETQIEIEVFPNPSNGFIELKGDLSRYNAMRVLDISGKQVLESAIKMNLDISTIENGLYILELVGETQMFKTKIIKE